MQAKNNAVREDVCGCEYISVKIKPTYSLPGVQSRERLSLVRESWAPRGCFMSLLSYSLKPTSDFIYPIHTKTSKGGLYERRISFIYNFHSLKPHHFGYKYLFYFPT